MAGHRLYGILVSGEADYTETWGPEDVSGACGWCGEDLATATYEEGVFWLECTAGHRHTIAVPPVLLEEHPEGQWQERVARWNSWRFALIRKGLCGLCGGHIPSWIERKRERFHYTGACERCGCRFITAVGCAVAHHPDMRACFRAHGRDLTRTPMWELDWCTHGAETVVSEDPLELEFDVACNGESVIATVDAEATVETSW